MNTLESVAPVSSTAVRIHEDDNTNAFLHRLAALVASIYVLFSEISQNDRHEIVKIEHKYTLYTKNSADMLTAQSSTALNTSLLALAFFTASFVCLHKDDQAFVQKVADQVTAFGNLSASHHTNSAKNYDAAASIQQLKLQDKSAKAQSEGNVKESFAQVLQAEIQRLRAASASGG